MKLGATFGSVPMGLHQVLARRCICDPRFIGVASDVACPVHGLAALLRDVARREAVA